MHCRRGQASCARWRRPESQRLLDPSRTPRTFAPYWSVTRSSFSLRTFVGVEPRVNLVWLVAFGWVVWMLSAHYVPARADWTFAACLPLAAAVAWRHGGRNVGPELVRPGALSQPPHEHSIRLGRRTPFGACLPTGVAVS